MNDLRSQLAKQKRYDALFVNSTKAFAILVLMSLGGILVSLIVGGGLLGFSLLSGGDGHSNFDADTHSDFDAHQSLELDAHSSIDPSAQRTRPSRHPGRGRWSDSGERL